MHSKGGSAAARRSRGRDFVIRSFWAVMLAGHAPALGAVSSRLFTEGFTLALGLKFLFLLGSVLYFTLKLAGFRFIKHEPSWNHLAVYFLIICLLHVGVIVEKGILVPIEGPGLVQLIGPFLLVLTTVSLFPLIRRRTLLAVKFARIDDSPRPYSKYIDQSSVAPASPEFIYPTTFRRGPPPSRT